jgi:hypothetical protein
MFRWLQNFIAREVIADVPVEMDLCLDCGKLACSEDRFQSCVHRKAHAARLTEALAEQREAPST